MFVLYHQIATHIKKDVFFLCFSYLQISSSGGRWRVEGLRQEQRLELRGGNNRSGNKSSGGGGVPGGVGGRAASHTHISLFSLEVYTTILPQPFSAVKSGARLR